MRARRLLVVGLVGGVAAVVLFGLGPAQPDAAPPAPSTALQRIAAANGDAAKAAKLALEARSQASAREADARTMRKAEAAER